jgi:dipeptidyl aminopeptidase/acylaminoacyl peptidase
MKYVFVTICLAAGFLSVSPDSLVGRPLTIEELVQIKQIEHPRLSPDGDAVVFEVRVADMEESRYQEDIYLYDLKKGETRRLVFTEEAETAPEWSPDGKYIGFLSPRGHEEEDDDDDDQDRTVQLWLLPTAGGEAEQITESEQSIEAFRFDPSGNRIYYLRSRGRSDSEERLKRLADDTKRDVIEVDKNRLEKEFRRYDLRSKESRCVFRGDPGIDEFDVSPDGKLIAYRSNRSGDPDRWIDYNIYLLSIADSSASLLADLGNEEQRPRFSPDGRKVAFLAPQDARYSFSQSELNVVDLVGREVTRLSRDIDLGIDDFCWNADSRGLVVNVRAGMNSGLYRISLPDLGISRVLAGKQYISSMCARSDSLVVVYSTSSTAPELGMLPRGSSTLFRLTDLNKLPDEATLPAQEVVTYRSPDDTEIEALLVRPVGFNPIRKYPAVVSVHGGPASRIVNVMHYRLHQALAADGYVVLAPNYRGSTGYDAEFNVANVGKLGAGDYEDVLAGAEYLAGLGYVDGGSIGITGASYGGYMTNWAISQSDRFAAAVSRYGIFNFFTDYGGSEYAYWERERLGDYWENDSLWLHYSPFQYVENIRTPVLILHGDEDVNTFPTNSMEMYRVLKDLGREVEFVRLPREGHGFSEPRHRQIATERILTFFGKHLQPRRPVATSGEMVTNEQGSVTFVQVDQLTPTFAPAAEGRYVAVRLELAGNRAKPLEIDLDRDVMLISDEYDRYLPSGMLMNNQLVQGARVELHRQVFVADLVFDIPVDLRQATVSVVGFPSLRIALRR